jgi:hypothetical protein
MSGASAVNHAFDDCGGPYPLGDANTASCWESTPTTLAERAVIEYFLQHPEFIRGKDLLHVGVGNGELLGTLAPLLGSYVGLTLSRSEQRQLEGRRPFPCETRTVLGNKYDPATTAGILDLDVIVDVNLKSFACCERHFRVMWTNFCRSLRAGGVIVTAQSGLDFGSRTRTDIAHTPLADPSTDLVDARTLCEEGLGRLVLEEGLLLASHEMLGVVHRHGTPNLEPMSGSELLWIVSKPETRINAREYGR